MRFDWSIELFANVRLLFIALVCLFNVVVCRRKQTELWRKKEDLVSLSSYIPTTNTTMLAMTPHFQLISDFFQLFFMCFSVNNHVRNFSVTVLRARCYYKLAD